MDIIKSDQKEKKKRYIISQHQLYAARPDVWRKLKRENTIDKRYLPMARRIAFMCYFTRPLQWLQIQFNRKRLKRISYEGKAPVFIIGHWRSGTTFLHNLMHKDHQFGYLSNYQTFIFTMALLSKKLIRALSRPLFPKERSQDNIKVSPYYPAEEEQPFTMISTRSGLHTFFFPRNRMYFDKYNVFKGITKREKRLWQRDYIYLLRNISLYNNNKPLLLKNPHNTGRIKELLELFPDAKFIYLHRDPYTTFISTLHMYDKVVRTQFFHDVSDEEIQDLVIYIARETLRKYLDDRHLIPEGNLIEVSYTDLEKQPYEMVKKIYETLSLPGFNKAESEIQKHVDSVKEYKKNIFKELSPELKERVKKELGFFFEEFGYE
ncbi:MAG: sulfotransferase [Candidatus Marinimicrobia bacterium]|nr:sulfotransferase [Candidatus Neomarinimicrobiota bacterium]